MGFRRVLAFLALPALVPAAAHSDTHPLECLGGISYSKETETAALETNEDDTSDDDDKAVQRVRLNCTWLVGTEYQVGVAGTDAGGTGTGGTSADVGTFGVFPAAVVTFGSSKSPEALFGVIAYLRKWHLLHPMVRVLPVGVTTTVDEDVRPAMVTGVSLDAIAPCPAGRGFWKGVCRVLGARVDLDAVHLWKEPRDSYLRWAFNFGLRLEFGEHPH